MWLFKKKIVAHRDGDNGSEQDKLKQKIQAQLIFDPVTMKMKIRTPPAGASKVWGAFSDLGISDEMIERREAELTASAGKNPSRASLFMSLFNENILKVKDLGEKERLYMTATRDLDRMGEDSFHLQKAAALSRLAALKKERYSSVYILTHQGCDACRKLEGTVITIEVAKKMMPIPIRECNNKREGDKYAICICSFEGEADDDFLNRTL